MGDFCCLLFSLTADGLCEAESEKGLVKLPVDRGAEVIVSTEVDGDPLEKGIAFFAALCDLRELLEVLRVLQPESLVEEEGPISVELSVCDHMGETCA